MTLEEMQAVAAAVVDALHKAGFGDAEYLTDHPAGSSLPIAFTSANGDEMVLELGVL